MHLHIPVKGGLLLNKLDYSCYQLYGPLYGAYGPLRNKTSTAFWTARRPLVEDRIGSRTPTPTVLRNFNTTCFHYQIDSKYRPPNIVSY